MEHAIRYGSNRIIIVQMSLHQVGTHLCKQTLTPPQMQASGPLQQSEEDREKGTQAGRGRERGEGKGETNGK